jgi:AraC-like DNA-binding protein
VWPGEDPATRLLCGGYDLGLDVATPFRRLPPLIHVSAAESRVRPALRATIELLSDEVQGGEPGAQVVADRLVDTLLVQVLRMWLARGSDSAAWWPQSSGDVGVAGVLDLIHERPEHPWTLAALAREVSMSRSTLARRFAAAMGEPPISYLTRWRMTLASELLCDTSTPLTAIAERVGYDSVFAFSNAFKRVSGEAPSHYRAMARSSVAPGGTGLPGVVAPQDG